MITIVPYQECWPDEFRAIAIELRRVLGQTALRIDHIGSTAVPGLAAKNVIDVQISVAALDASLASMLAGLGYTRVESITGDHLPPNHEASNVEWQKWFFRAPPGQRPTNTHVRVLGRANQRYPLLFRDYLRTRPTVARAYAELKRRLAQHLPAEGLYPEVKVPAVDLIYLAAEDWAKTTQWRPGPADA